MQQCQQSAEHRVLIESMRIRSGMSARTDPLFGVLSAEALLQTRGPPVQEGSQFLGTVLGGADSIFTGGPTNSLIPCKTFWVCNFSPREHFI
jgi:hypothetical protein